jgi:microtubule-associated protein-like 1/2
VLYNIDEQSQRHYLGHTDDIKSLAIHPNKLLIATGQCAGQDRRTASPHIRVWNSVSLATMAIIGAGEFQTAVTSVSFSQADNGTLLLAIDDSTEKTISVWEWSKGETGKKVTETKCSVDTVVGAEFHPLDRNQIITIGKNHIAFWTLDQNGALYKKMGIFDSREKPKYVTCLTFTAFGDVVTGDSNGNIILWGRGTNAIGKFVKKVHEGSVFSICALRNGKLISGGGKDGRLVLLGEDLSPCGVENYIEPHFGAVRVATQGKGAQVLVGTTKNCILSGDLEMGFTPVVMGHTDELWGLAIHPNMPQFITGGRDRLLQLWDTLSHSVVWSKDIGEQVQCVEFLPDGEFVLVGSLVGKWLVFDSMSRELLSQYTDGNEPIQTIKASPNGQLVAIGSRDNTIYIYQRTGVPHKFNRIGKCNGHSSFILHLDWSVDGEYLRSNSGDYELLFCKFIIF